MNKTQLEALMDWVQAAIEVELQKVRDTDGDSYYVDQYYGMEYQCKERLFAAFNIKNEECYTTKETQSS